MFPLSDTKSPGKLPVLTLLLILINIGVFWWELNIPDFQEIVLNYGLVPEKVNFIHLTTLYPFLTSLFLHGGFLHVASNMWFLWIFGDNVESRLGIFFLPFYLLCGLISNFIQYFIFAGSAIPAIGASGAIAGVMGAYIYLFPKNQIQTLILIVILPLIIKLSATTLILYWFLIQIIDGYFSLISNLSSLGGIAYFAHIGGFLAGWLLTKPFLNPLRNK